MDLPAASFGEYNPKRFKDLTSETHASRKMGPLSLTRGDGEKLVVYPHTINWQNGLPVPHKAESISIDLSDIWDEPLKLECQAFLKAIETGDEPVTSGTEGLRVLKILELSQQSIENKERGFSPNPLPITHDLLPGVSYP